ncbi:MAG: alpha-hydroxy acid oxidase, partial [Pseudomonadota bacterium]
ASQKFDWRGLESLQDDRSSNSMKKLKDALNIADLRVLAEKRLPRMVFDYIDGGADDEITLNRSVSRYDDYELTWKSLVDIENIDTSIEVMGANSSLPFFISPTASNRLFHPRQGELATAQAAGKAGIIYACSTIASQTLEDIAKATDGPKWVQVYVWRDRQLVENFLKRAKAAGFTGCILTVDVPVAGNRERDPRNKFSVPPKPSMSLARQALARPGWLADFITSSKIEVSNFTEINSGDTDIIGYINSQFSPSVTWDDAAWMKDVWGNGFAIKGISNPTDAARCIEVGADAVWISNHGGRQLDTSVPTIDLIPDIAAAVNGRADIIVDGGIRRGAHIAKALARGATGVAIGRAWLYGLGAGGEAGVSRSIEILETELKRTMALMGITRIADLSPSMVHGPIS